MPTDSSSAYLTRWLESGIDDYLKTLCPSEQGRVLAAQFLADAITRANSLNPDSWALTKKPKYIRWNVGHEAAVWAPGNSALEANIRSPFPEFPFFAMMVDLPTIERAGIGASHVDFIIDYGLPTTPSSYYAALPTGRVPTFRKGCALFRDAHFAHLANVKAKRIAINPTARSAHHPGLVDAVARLAGRELPQPRFVRVARP